MRGIEDVWGRGHVRSPVFRSRSEFRQVGVELPFRDGVVEAPPFLLLEIDIGGVELGTEHFARERVGREGFDRFRSVRGRLLTPRFLSSASLSSYMLTLLGSPGSRSRSIPSMPAARTMAAAR